MADEQSSKGPDLTLGISVADLVDGKLVGHVGKDEVLVVAAGGELFAIDAYCSHYHGPLVDGLVVDGGIRCPWHHACFKLRTGEATRAPAFSALSCWHIEQRDGEIFVTGRTEPKVVPASATKPADSAPEQIVIVGAGAAGFAAAEMLRRQDYRGRLILVGKEAAAPIDRPNLSKDYLAGGAPEGWIPLKPDSYYREARIDLRSNCEVSKIDATARRVVLHDGEVIAYDRLLLATGAEPVCLPIPGADLPNVHVLRSLDDSRAIIGAAEHAKRVLVIGASFIGLEVAAALRTRDIEVHVVAPEARPMERVLGPQMGDFVRSLHQEHGVVFHLEDTVVMIDGARATLKSGKTIDADLVVAGVGVRPRLALAEAAGLAIDRGVLVDSYLETNIAGIYAAGDIARWPDPHSGESIRVEHWVVAQRQGQTAARNMLGQRQVFDAVPFFWSQHYDVPINYVGHAENWDDIIIDGDIITRDCVLRYIRNGRVLAVASIYRDLDNLKAERAMELHVAV